MRYLQTLNYDFNEILGMSGKPFVPSEVFSKGVQKDFISLKRYLAKLGVTLSYIVDKKLRKRDVVVSGEFDGDADKIIVYVSTNKGMCNVNYNRYKRIKTVTEIIITVMHEMIHRKQYEYRGTLNDKHYLFNRTGDPKLDEEYEYLSDTDEVPAFAHCAYTELKIQCRGMTIRQALRSRKVKSEVLTLYKSMYKPSSDTMVEFYRALFRWERLYNEFNSRVQATC